MYKLNFLPLAKQDMDNIIYYVSNNLKNKSASKKLAENFINGANNILEFPYGCAVYEKKGKKEEEKYTQISINFDTIEPKVNVIEEKLKEINPLEITPLEALNILYDLKNEIKDD